ncbi:MAG: FecR domain-containing protein [Candidatus Rifleibacteriota bacterium]
MKRAGLVILAVLFFMSAGMAYAKDSGVRFSNLSGEVLVRPDEDILGWEFAQLDMILDVMDHVQTKHDSTAIMTLSDLTTFVMKPESEIVLNTESEKENKIKLLAGKVWVNVKKMIKDGSMDVEMSQAVAGIKGTNITCSSNKDGSENRVKVLRGQARVMIRETRQEIALAMGEELVIKKGVKPEKNKIDVEEAQKEWDDATSKLGESIQLNEVPDILQKINESEAQEIGRLKEEFEKFINLDKVEAEEVAELQRDAERFVGVVLEDTLIINSIKKKIDDALAQPGISETERAKMQQLLRQTNSVSANIQTNREEALKIMRYQFELSALYEDISAEVEMVMNDVDSIISEVENIQTEISNNPSGRSQDWFIESQEILQDKMAELEEALEKAQILVEKNPEDQSAQNLVKQITDQQSNIAAMIKELAIVEIDPATIIEMQQIDDLLSDQMVALQSEITAYNSIDSATTDIAERRLQSSLRIMDNYARVRRYYLSAQRLYDSTMRSMQSANYKTSEQEEIENIWQNVSNRFQQLGIVADELQSNIESLESQLRHFLD